MPVRLAGKAKNVITVFPIGTVQTKMLLILAILMELPARNPTNAGASKVATL